MTLYAGNHPMFSALFGALNGMADEYSKLSSELEAATGNRESAIQSLMDTSDDPEMVQLREAIARATEKLRSMAESRVNTTSMSEEQVNAAKEKVASLKKNLRDGAQAIEKLTGLPDIFVDDEVKGAVEKLNGIIKVRGGGSSTGTGTGIPKARVTVTVQGGNFESPTAFPNLSTVAQKFNMESLDLLKAYAEAAGVELSKVSSVKTVTTFTIKPNENGSEYTLVVTPKSLSAKQDAEKTDTSESAESNDDTAAVPSQDTAA
jgi:hypothetical protein